MAHHYITVENIYFKLYVQIREGHSIQEVWISLLCILNNLNYTCFGYFSSKHQLSKARENGLSFSTSLWNFTALVEVIEEQLILCFLIFFSVSVLKSLKSFQSTKSNVSNFTQCFRAISLAFKICIYVYVHYKEKESALNPHFSLELRFFFQH